ncbi:MAG TPA: peptidoglycan recognition family protein [Tepidisphaeraceae bacterium]|nr:peptidoglycan recognition family protein [Tepidisphaeraceae bacterium]
MAFRFARVAIVSCTIGAAVAGGCASPAVMDTLPEPNFNGPVVAAPPPPPAQPKFTTPDPVRPAPPPVASGRMTGPREWTPGVPSRQWNWIVIHHSATATGSAATFDKMHKDKGWDELGYHFVIGNGTNSGNGQVEVGTRWKQQKWGAHAKTADNRYNDYGIGICLVGNFDVDRPTPAQQQSLAKLVAFLEKSYKISDARVIGHGETKPTECPGRFLNIAQVRSQARAVLAEAGDLPQPVPVAVTASGELLTDTE